MTRALFLVLVTCIIFSCIHQTKRDGEKQIESNPYPSKKINFVKRNGSSFERGVQYGATIKEDIQGQLSIWAKLCQEEIGLTQEELYVLLKRKTGFIEAIKKYAPDLLEELQGVAQGAEVSVQNLICFNLAEEIMVYLSKGYDKCTNIGLKSKTTNSIVYNLDLPDFLRNFRPVMLQDSKQFVYTIPGLVATGGMNRNFTITTNSLPKLNMDLNGLPLPFFIRKLLQCPTETEAIELLRSTPFGAPQNLMIVGRRGIWDFECSANQIVQYENTANKSIVFHTNDALVNTEIRDKSTNETCGRFTYLDSIFNDKKHDGEIALKALIDAINHRESGIRYEGNYFSFIGQYPKDTAQSPVLEVLLPKENEKKIFLVFDRDQ